MSLSHRERAKFFNLSSSLTDEDDSIKAITLRQLPITAQASKYSETSMGFDKETKIGQFGGKKVTQSSNVDDTVLNNLTNLVSALNSEVGSRDFQPLVQFFRKGYASQVIQLWSYYAQVNNHPKFSKSTTLLVNTLRLLDSDKNVHEHGCTLIDLILSGQIKVLYRGLNNLRASLSNPVLRLMKEMICFSSGRYVDDFIANFDFSLPSLIRILNVNKADIPAVSEEVKNNTRLSIRREFLEFWITLISLCASLPRKQVMTENSKIMGAWFKSMDKLDSPSLMTRALDLFKNQILGESSYKRTTKCQILNELALSKIHSFYRSTDKALVKKVNEFFLAYGCDEGTNIAFPDDAVWFSESPFNGTHKGAEIIVNQRSFKIYNKLLFNVLKFFKPWEDDMQANTVIKILNNVPELVAPYSTFLSSHGSHEPKMTSYWFGCTMVLGRIIRLEIPLFMKQVETDVNPSISLVMESILPSPLTKVALVKALQHEKLIIRQLACHLIVFAFQKLEAVLQLFDTKGWSSAKTTLRNAFHQGIPDLSIIVSVMNQAYITNKENQILQLSISTILRYYSITFPNFFSIKLPSSNVFVDVMHKEKFSGIELALLNNFLQFQELSGLQTKWWVKNSRERSIFTSLLNVARTSPRPLSDKICELLESMFRGNVAFNKLLCSPLKALIHSLRILSSEADEEEMAKVWALLDQTVQHCMTTPYKYVDLAANYCRVSPFVMALFEQWKFVKCETDFDLPLKWFSIYLRTMIVCGEPEDGLNMGVKAYLPEVCEVYIKRYLGDSDGSATFPNDELFRSSIMESSFLELILLSPYPGLRRISRLPVSQLDTVGLIYRINRLVNDHSIKFDEQFKSIVEDFARKLTGYGAADRSFNTSILKFLESLIGTSRNENGLGLVTLKGLYVIHLVLGLAEEFEFDYQSLSDTVFDWLKCDVDIFQSLNEDDSHILSSLFACLTSTQCIQLIEDNQKINRYLTQRLLTIVLKHSHDSLPYPIVSWLLKEESAMFSLLTSRFISQGRVNGFVAADFLPLVLKSDVYSIVVEAYVDSVFFAVEDLLSFLDQIKQPKTSLIVATSLKNYKDTRVESFIERVYKESFQSLKSYNLETSQIALKLYCASTQLITPQERVLLVDYLVSDYRGKYGAAVTSLLITVASFEDSKVLKWLNKLMLYITRNLSSSRIIDPELVITLQALRRLPDYAWDKLNQRILEAQLEAILSGNQINHPDVLQYVLQTCLFGCKDGTQYSRLMQLLLNNQLNGLRKEESERYVPYLTAAILYTLYLGDPAQCSNAAIQEHLLKSYEGTISGKDRLILRLLELIETKTFQSWTDGIFAWEILEVADEDGNATKLINKQREGYVITLNRQKIINSAIYYSPYRSEVPSVTHEDAKSALESITSFYKETERISTIPTYDAFFLMLLSTHNEELIKCSRSEDGSLKYTFNVKAYISSNIFQVILCSLGGDSEMQELALVLIKGLLSSIQENSNSKDMRVVELLLSKIVYTFQKTESKEDGYSKAIAPCIWFAISQLTSELVQTGSQLHEKAFRWVLSSPVIRHNDMPLLQELLHPKANIAEQGLFYRQLGWILNCLQHGLKSEQDVELMKRMGVLEWLSNLTSLPYINGKMRSSINGIFYACQKIGNGGSSLITRVASVSFSEIQELSLDYKTMKAKQEIARNQKNMRHTQKLLFFEQQKLNVQEVLSRNLVLIGSNKRLRDWTENDSENIRKRTVK